MSGGGESRHQAHAKSENVFPIRELKEDWLDLAFKIPAPRPRIAPGRYEARSASLTKFEAFKRTNLELGFDVFRGEAHHGVVLARIPLFVRYPGPKGLAPNSTLARLFHLLYREVKDPPRWGQRLSLEALRDKLWDVLVGDAEQDTDGNSLPEGNRYSRIIQVLGRLA